MNTRNITLKAKIENVITELMVKTNTNNVYLEDGVTTLSSKLTELISDIANKCSGSDVDAKISTAISQLINGAPETYDTLKEIADYITSHEDVVTALNQAIGNKVDKQEGYGLSKNDFTDELLNKLNSITQITVDDALSETSENAVQNKVVTAAINAKTNIFIQSTQPTELKENDLWIEI